MQRFATAIILVAIGAQAAEVPEPAKPYISGEVFSKENFQYGRFVTKIKGSDRKGTLASFQTLFIGNEEEPLIHGENWNQINFEINPSDEHTVLTNLITAYANEEVHVKDFDPEDEWHKYEITWTPDYISFSIDDERRRYEEKCNEVLADMNKEQHLNLAFWTPNEDEENLEDDTSTPWYTRYEYVEAYDWKGKDETGEDIFELRFRDDFDHLDTDRWFLSTNKTFSSTSTQFVTQNAYVEDGNLVLKMEKVGKKPKKPNKPTKPKKPVDNWHVLPPPKPDSLDRAIEKSTRVLVSMVRHQLENFSESMSGHLM